MNIVAVASNLELGFHPATALIFGGLLTIFTRSVRINGDGNRSYFRVVVCTHPRGGKCFSSYPLGI